MRTISCDVGLRKLVFVIVDPSKILDTMQYIAVDVLEGSKYDGKTLPHAKVSSMVASSLRKNFNLLFCPTPEVLVIERQFRKNPKCKLVESTITSIFEFMGVKVIHQAPGSKFKNVYNGKLPQKRSQIKELAFTCLQKICNDCRRPDIPLRISCSTFKHDISDAFLILIQYHMEKNKTKNNGW